MAPVLTPRDKIARKMWFKVQHYARMLWAAVIQVSFVFTVVAMMVSGSGMALVSHCSLASVQLVWSKLSVCASFDAFSS